MDKDSYYKKAKREGYPSRAVYKLIEIDDRFRIFQEKSRVLDLGASPGSWSQLTLKRTNGLVVAVDLAPLRIKGVEFVQGDINLEETRKKVKEKFGYFNVIICDAAPKLSGINSIDQARDLELCNSAFLFAEAMLKNGGNMVIKAFQGEGFKEFFDSIKFRFRVCKCFSPKASKKHSSEIYIVAKGFT